MLYNLLPTTLQLFLTSLLWHPPSTPPSPTLQFQLRHHHALSNTSRVIFSDTKPELAFAAGAFSIPTKPMTVHRPTSQALLRSARFRGGNVPWEPSEVYGPDVQDRETLLLLAKMANNAYTEPDKSDWYDIGPYWNVVSTALDFVPPPSSNIGKCRIADCISEKVQRGSRSSASVYANPGMSSSWFRQNLSPLSHDLLLVSRPPTPLPLSTAFRLSATRLRTHYVRVYAV